MRGPSTSTACTRSSSRSSAPSGFRRSAARIRGRRAAPSARALRAGGHGCRSRAAHRPGRPAAHATAAAARSRPAPPGARGFTDMWTLAWWWALFALPLPWLVRRFVPAEPLDREAALKVPAAREFADLAGAGAPLKWKRFQLAALVAVWLLCVLAAARPQYVGEPVALPTTGRDLLLAVDLSGSMEEQDFQLNGQWVDRLTALKAVADDFIARRVGDRVGLIL